MPNANAQSWIPLNDTMGFAVLRCSSKSYFHANLTIKISYSWDRPFQLTYPRSNSLNEQELYSRESRPVLTVCLNAWGIYFLIKNKKHTWENYSNS